jgi:hypothetical protein
MEVCSARCRSGPAAPSMPLAPSMRNTPPRQRIACTERVARAEPPRPVHRFQRPRRRYPRQGAREPVFTVLINTAGGKDKVAAYGATLLSTPSSKSSTHPGKASHSHPSSHSTGAPAPIRPAPRSLRATPRRRRGPSRPLSPGVAGALGPGRCTRTHRPGPLYVQARTIMAMSGHVIARLCFARRLRQADTRRRGRRLRPGT